MHEHQLDTFVSISKKILKKEAPLIVEIGARDCTETLAFHSYFPLSPIYTFECNPDTLPLCRTRIKNIPFIHLTEKAVTDSVGYLSFFKIKKESDEWNPGGSSLFTFEKNNLPQEKIEVETTTLAHEMKEKNIPHIDMLWMDIQGAELSVLKGSPEILPEISLIHTEVEFFTLYKNQPLFKDIKQYLNSQGFKLLTFTSMGKYSGDAVFINTKLASPRCPEWLIIFYFTYIDIWINKNRGIRRRLHI